MTGQRSGAESERYAADYDTALARGIAVSGENKDFFAHGKVEWLAARRKPSNPTVADAREDEVTMRAITRDPSGPI